MSLEGEAGAEDVIAKKADLVGLLDGEAQTADGRRILGTDVEVTVLRTDGVAGNGHTLDNGKGVTLEDRTVHKGAGVTLVTVTNNVLVVVLLSVSELPLATGGEATAAAAAKTRIQDLLDDVGTVHREGTGKTGVSAVAEGLVDRLGVDGAAAVQGDSLLLLVEVDVLLTGDGLTGLGLDEEQALNDLAADKILLDDLLDVLESYETVESVLGVDLNERTLRAVAEAADLVDRNAVGKTLFGNKIGDLLLDLGRIRRKAAGTAAKHDGALAVLAVEFVTESVGARAHFALQFFSAGNLTHASAPPSFL